MGILYIFALCAFLALGIVAQKLGNGHWGWGLGLFLAGGGGYALAWGLMSPRKKKAFSSGFGLFGGPGAGWCGCLSHLSV
ncbi:MAG: hypothetical protein HC913_09095 [Microscillaceae bacterium]|nr:hypothetical protein [Microscillaceae bacterium]